MLLTGLHTDQLRFCGPLAPSQQIAATSICWVVLPEGWDRGVTAAVVYLQLWCFQSRGQIA
jgi:hypothetical protein